MKRGTNPNSLKNLEAHKIKPGEIRNPIGKLAGTKDKITLIRNTILNGFDPVEFKTWKAKEQTEFMKLLVKIMPQDVKLDIGLTLPADDPVVLDQKMKASLQRLGYAKAKKDS